jgi:hypothetical protein
MKTLPRVYLVVTVLLLAGGWVVTMPRAAHAQSCPTSSLISNNLFASGLSWSDTTPSAFITTTGQPCGFVTGYDLAEDSNGQIESFVPFNDESYSVQLNVWAEGGTDLDFLIDTYPLHSFALSGTGWQFYSVCVERPHSSGFNSLGAPLVVVGNGRITAVNYLLTSTCFPPTPIPTATATPGGVVGTPVAVTATPSGVLLPPAIPTYEPIELQPITPVPGVFFDTAPAELPSDEGYDFSGWGVPALPEAIPIAESEYAFELDELFDYDNIVLVFQIVRTYPNLIRNFPGWMYVIFAVVIVLSLRFFIGVATQRRQAAAAEEREAAREERESNILRRGER